MYALCGKNCFAPNQMNIRDKKTFEDKKKVLNDRELIRKQFNCKYVCG